MSPPSPPCCPSPLSPLLSSDWRGSGGGRLHGFPQGWYLWRNQIDPLVAAGYRVAVPDLRGYGGSSKPQQVEAYAAANICQDVVSLAKKLGQEKFLLVGHDFGCYMAWRTAAFFPDNVRAVVGLDVAYGTARQTSVDTSSGTRS